MSYTSQIMGDDTDKIDEEFEELVEDIGEQNFELETGDDNEGEPEGSLIIDGPAEDPFSDTDSWVAIQAQIAGSNILI